MYGKSYSRCYGLAIVKRLHLSFPMFLHKRIFFTSGVVATKLFGYKTSRFAGNGGEYTFTIKFELHTTDNWAFHMNNGKVKCIFYSVTNMLTALLEYMYDSRVSCVKASHLGTNRLVVS